MKKDCFKLLVPVGTLIFSSAGEYYVEEIPEDALERISNGSVWLGFTEKAIPELAKLSEYKLKALLKLRTEQGFESDAKILEQALALQSEPAKPAKETPQKETQKK